MNRTASVVSGCTLLLLSLLFLSSTQGDLRAQTAGSGRANVPVPPKARTTPGSYPRLSGTYTSSAQHPRVFTTAADLEDLARRISIRGSFSSQSYAKLAGQIKQDVASNIDWNATYSGSEVDVYLHGFSYEPGPSYASDTGKETNLRLAMHVEAGHSVPKGAAVVASRLALYAALRQAGAPEIAGAPTGDQAKDIAKRILLAWATKGFKDENGSLRHTTSQFCRAGRVAQPIGIALQLSRGVVYSVQAQDLLEGLGAFSAEESAAASRFHAGMYESIRNLSNEEYTYNLTARYPDEMYNNQFACHLAGMLAIARLLDDGKKVEAVLYGGEGAGIVKLPWANLFDHVLYGPSDRPLLRITPNTTSDPLTSRPAYTTSVVAAGEINDRYRNLNPLQSIGYAMGTLEWLFDSAELLRLAGFDAYGYRGAHQQTLEMAAQYYAYYGKNVGYYKTVPAAGMETYPDYQEYVGKIVNDVEPSVTIAAYRFPGNDRITDAEQAAHAAWISRTDFIDAVRFGKWRN